MEIDNLAEYSSVAKFDSFSDKSSDGKDTWVIDELVALGKVGMGEPYNLPWYTTDDIVAHNGELGKRDWFKYGRKVYSLDTLSTIVKELIKQDEDILNNPNVIHEYRYPIYAVRKVGFTKNQLKKILSVCVVANLEEVDNGILLARFKDDVENTLEVLSDTVEFPADSDNITAFRDQLNRWLQDYPFVESERYVQPANCVDPNDENFPLPRQIMFDPMVLRKWIENWKPFDHEIAEDCVWETHELINDDVGDPDKVFADLVKAHVDDDMDDFDMEIDGEAAWNVIEQDIVKEDKTTEEQEIIWKLRECRTRLNDPKWMRRRREQIADKLIRRHQWSQNKMPTFLTFCDNLEKDWKTFQELCN